MRSERRVERARRNRPTDGLAACFFACLLPSSPPDLVQLLDYIVMSVYLVVILAAGVAFARKSGEQGMESFFGGGGQVPWWISGTSLFMSFFSAGTFVVWGTIAYEQGVVAVTMQWTMAAGGGVAALWMAPRWRRSGALTAAEFIKKRFGTASQQFYSYLVLFYGVLATGAVLYPVAKMMAVATPFSLTTCILVIGAVVILYTTAGGLWAVLITDTLQFVILTVAVIALVPLALAAVGGPGALAAQAPADFFTLTSDEYTPAFIAAFVFYHIILVGGRWGFVQRYTSVPSARDARKVGLLFAGAYLVAPMIWMLPPMAYQVMEPGLTGLDTEGAYILVSEAVLPVGVIGLMFSAMISATASSANTTLNITAAVITNDIYTDMLSPEATEREQMIVARASTVAVGAAMVSVALLVPAVGGIVDVVISMAALLAVPIMAPPLWALFSEYLTARGAQAATLAGFVLNLFFKFAAPPLWGLSLSTGAEMAVGVAGPVLVLGAFELAARRRGHRGPGFQRAFAGTTDETQHETEAASGEAASGEAADANQQRFGLRVLVGVMGLAGAGLLVLAFFAPDRPWVAVGMGLPILALAAFVWRMQRRAREDDGPPADGGRRTADRRARNANVEE